MPSIEQVSKRVFSDRNWLKKCAIGGVISLVPIVNILSMGYLYQVFLEGKRGNEVKLPEWEDLKALFLDGLRFLVIGLVFAALPIALISICAGFAFDGFFAKVAVMPVVFFAGPVMSAALYLYSIKQDIADSLNFEALSIMLKKGAYSYTMPTLAYIGVCWAGWPLVPFAFFGGIFYFYLMARSFRDLEQPA